MFVRKKKYPSGNIGVIVVEKIGGKMKELATIGVAYSEDEVENLDRRGASQPSLCVAVRHLSNLRTCLTVVRKLPDRVLKHAKPQVETCQMSKAVSIL